MTGLAAASFLKSIGDGLLPQTLLKGREVRGGCFSSAGKSGFSVRVVLSVVIGLGMWHLRGTAVTTSIWPLSFSHPGEGSMSWD